MSGMKMLILMLINNDPATIKPRSHRSVSTIIMILQCSIRSNYDHTTSYPIATRSYYASNAIIAHVPTTIILRSYRDLTTFLAIKSTSCCVSILFHSFYFWIIRRFLGNNTVMSPKSTRKLVCGCRGRCWGWGGSDSNESWSSRDGGPTNQTWIPIYIKWRCFSDR